MNIDEIMTLVKAVSDYNLTSFELEEGNVKISLKREKEMPQIVTVGAPSMDAASAAVSAQMMGAAMAAGRHPLGHRKALRHHRRGPCAGQ